MWKLLQAVGSPEAVGPALREGFMQSHESIASFSIMILLLLLLAAIVLGFWIDDALPPRIARYMPEASSSLVIGMVAGAITAAFASETRQTEFLSFSPEFFFLFLLPPIIFESGSTMDPGPFSNNFGAILLFAFGGTLVSAVGVGVVMWLLGAMRLCFRLTFVESLLFGAVISATDTVTVLNIFKMLRVDEDMYALVFGESVLNDAVAMVLYRAFKRFLVQEVSWSAIGRASGEFFTTFLGSIGIGAAIAVLSALQFRWGTFRAREGSEHGHLLEATLLAIWAYVAYMLAEGLELSGIVAILVTGIGMARYTVKNLSDGAREAAFAFFKILALGADKFVFVYVGVSMFLIGLAWNHVALFVFSLAAVLATRFAYVWPGVRLVNLARPANRSIPEAHKKMLWFSCLRGGMAFALAISTVRDLNGSEASRAILSVTMGIAAVTVLVIGGTSHAAVEKLGLRASPLRATPAHPSPPHALPSRYLPLDTSVASSELAVVESRDDMTVDGVGNGNGVGVHGGQRGSQRSFGSSPPVVSNDAGRPSPPPQTEGRRAAVLDRVSGSGGAGSVGGGGSGARGGGGGVGGGGSGARGGGAGAGGGAWGADAEVGGPVAAFVQATMRAASSHVSRVARRLPSFTSLERRFIQPALLGTDVSRATGGDAPRPDGGADVEEGVVVTEAEQGRGERDADVTAKVVVGRGPEAGGSGEVRGSGARGEGAGRGGAVESRESSDVPGAVGVTGGGTRRRPSWVDAAFDAAAAGADGKGPASPGADRAGERGRNSAKEEAGAVPARATAPAVVARTREGPAGPGTARERGAGVSPGPHRSPGTPGGARRVLGPKETGKGD